jgi:peptidyl-prolyl cis-trans isomerase A (cyclophilin A)
VFSARVAAAPVRVELETDAGVIHCSLDPTHAPRAVALFVGLATGRARWLDPETHAVTSRAMYRDLPFTRAIPSAFIQSGDPIGDGSGNPGYRIPVEAHATDAERLAKPGTIVLARYTLAPGRVDPAPPPPGDVLGSQFAVLLTDMRHLAGRVSVLGYCADLDIARAIAEDVGKRRVARRLRQVRVR